MYMEYNNLKEKEIVVDIECGGTSCGDDTENDSVSGKKHGEEFLKKLGSTILGFSGPSKFEPNLNSKGVSGESIKEPNESLRLLIGKNTGGLQSHDLMLVTENRHEKQRPKIGKSKKAPKPPRPPKGPNLDAVDMERMKETFLLATKKRERIKRMKAAKSSSPSPSYCSTLPATIITILFCLVIIFQGLCSRNSSPVIVGAPMPAMMNKGLISVEFHNNDMSNDDSVPNSYSPNSAKQLSGLDFRFRE